MTLHPDFVNSLGNILPEDEIPFFLEAIDREAAVSVRFNPYKTVQTEINGDKVAWCDDAVTLNERISFTLDPLFHGGAYYVQESSSMFLGHVLKTLAGENMSGLRLLDLCAAPGGKTTHAASVIGPNNLLVSNEVIRSRAGILRENVIKWGSGNIIVTNNDPKDFGKLRHFFDILIVDAPCSGEGMFRKNEKARGEWSLRNVKLCGERQRRILSDAWDSLKPGGWLIYSTCTFNRSENEEQIEWLEKEFGAEVYTDIPVFDGITATDKGFRFYPHKVNGEGLFLGIVRKAGENTGKNKYPKPQPFPKVDKKQFPLKIDLTPYELFTFNDAVSLINKDLFNDLQLLGQNLNVVYAGVEAGEIIHGKLKPSHALALWPGLPEDTFPTAETELETALEYLRKNNIDAGPFHEGYNIVKYKGLPVGFVKKIGNRVNNLYPKESRIMFL